MHIGVKSRRVRGTSLQSRQVKHAVLLHLQGEPDPRAVAFAAGLAADVQHTLVVVDLPPGSLDSHVDAITTALSKREGSLRLVFVRGSSREVRALGRHIAYQLDKTVVVHDAEVVRTTGGGLFVPSHTGTGWLVFRPGHGPQLDSQRFPKPSWEVPSFSSSWETSADSVVRVAAQWHVGTRREQGEGGHGPQVADGALAVPSRDPSLWWSAAPEAPKCPSWTSPDSGRPFSLRCAPGCGSSTTGPYRGRVAARTDRTWPIGSARRSSCTPACRWSPRRRVQEPAVITLHKEATSESRPFVRELIYFPRTGTQAASPPGLLGLRRPVVRIPEISTGVYEYASDAVLEIVQSGLWMRPPGEPANGGRRAASARRAWPLRDLLRPQNVGDGRAHEGAC